MVEFNLSEKAMVMIGKGSELDIYASKAVKEFIKLLKEEMCILKGTHKEEFKLIDKLAGSKLI